MSYEHSKGHSLVEMAAAISILLIVAAIAAPSFNGRYDNQKLDAASNKVFNALRFTRSEAIRLGVPHEIYFESTSVIKVYRLENNGTTLIRKELSQHPLNKKDYIVDLNSVTDTSGVLFSSSGHHAVYDQIGTRTQVFFSEQGRPFFKESDGTYHRFNSGDFTLEFKNASRTISIGRMTGKIQRL